MNTETLNDKYEKIFAPKLESVLSDTDSSTSIICYTIRSHRWMVLMKLWYILVGKAPKNLSDDNLLVWCETYYNNNTKELLIEVVTEILNN